MIFFKYKRYQVGNYIRKWKYNKLMKQIRSGVKIKRVIIEKTISDYFEDIKNIFFNHHNFPYLDNELFDATNKEMQYQAYSSILSNIIRIKKDSPSLTLNMYETLLGSKIEHHHTLLDFLLTQKQYAFTKDEVDILTKIDNHSPHTRDFNHELGG